MKKMSLTKVEWSGNSSSNSSWQLHRLQHRPKRGEELQGFLVAQLERLEELDSIKGQEVSLLELEASHMELQVLEDHSLEQHQLLVEAPLQVD
jgi:hypothetical protein